MDVAFAHALGIAGVSLQLGLGGGQVQALGHRLEDQQLVAAVQHVLLGVGQQGVGVVVAHEAGEELVQRLVAEHGRVAVIIAQLAAHLVVQHHFGDAGHGAVLGQVVHHGVGQVGAVEAVVEILVHVRHRVQVVGRAEVLLHPGVGGLGQDADRQAVQGDVEHRLFARQGDDVAVRVGGVAVAVGEGDGHVKAVPHVVAHDLLLKAGDEGAAAQGQVIALGGAAGKDHPVHRAAVVDVGDVAVLGGPAGHRLLDAVGLQQVIPLGLDLLLRGLDVRLFEGDGRVVLGQGDVIQRAHPFPVAVAGQALAVGKVLIVVVGGGAQDLRAGGLGRGRRSAAARRGHGEGKGRGQSRGRTKLFQQR